MHIHKNRNVRACICIGPYQLQSSLTDGVCQCECFIVACQNSGSYVRACESTCMSVGVCDSVRKMCDQLCVCAYTFSLRERMSAGGKTVLTAEIKGMGFVQQNALDIRRLTLQTIATYSVSLTYCLEL